MVEVAWLQVADVGFSCVVIIVTVFILLGFVCWRVDRRKTHGYVSIFDGQIAFWAPFGDGKTIGQEGSEQAITSSVYGWMVHTRFFSTEAEAIAQFDAMKQSLSEIIATIPTADDPDAYAKMGGISDALSLFIKQYP